MRYALVLGAIAIAIFLVEIGLLGGTGWLALVPADFHGIELITHIFDHQNVEILQLD